MNVLGLFAPCKLSPHSHSELIYANVPDLDSSFLCAFLSILLFKKIFNGYFN